MKKGIVLFVVFLFALIHMKQEVRALPPLKIGSNKISTVESYLSNFDRIGRTLTEESAIEYFLSFDPKCEHFLQFLTIINELVDQGCEVTVRIITLKQAALQKAITPQDFLTIVDYGIERPSEDYVKATTALIKKNADLFLKLQPTSAELAFLRGRYPGVEGFLKRIVPTVLEHASTAEGYLYIMSGMYSDKIPTTSSYFLNLSPTLQEVNQYLRIGHHFPHEYKITVKQAALNRGLVKDINEYFSLMDSGMQYATAENISVMGTFISENIRMFQCLNPTWEDKCKVLRKYPKAMLGLESDFQHELQKVKTVPDYFRFVQSLPSSLIEGTLDTFFYLSPTAEEIMQFLRCKYPISDAGKEKLKRAVFEQGSIKSTKEFLTLIDLDNEASRILFLDQINLFFSLEPTWEEVCNAAKKYDAYEALKPCLEAQLQEQRSVQAYLQFMENLPEKWWGEAIPYFLTLSPSAEEIIALMKSRYFPQDNWENISPVYYDLIRRGLDSVKTSGQFIELVMDHKSRYDFLSVFQKKVMEILLKEKKLDPFVKLNPTWEEIQKLISIHANLKNEEPIKQCVKSKIKEEIKTAQEYLSKTVHRELISTCNIGLWAAYYFTSLSPTLDEIKQFIVSECSKGINRPSQIRAIEYAFEKKLPKNMQEYSSLIYVGGNKNLTSTSIEEMCNAITAHFRLLNKLDPSKEYIEQLIGTYPPLVEWLYPFTLPLELKSLGTWVEEKEKYAYQRIEDTTKNWEKEVSAQPLGWHVFLQESITRNTSFCKRHVQRATKETNRQLQEVKDWKTEKHFILNKLNHYAKTIHRLANQADKRLKREFQLIKCPGVSNEGITSPKHFLKIVQEKDVHELIRKQNQVDRKLKKVLKGPPLPTKDSAEPDKESDEVMETQEAIGELSVPTKDLGKLVKESSEEVREAPLNCRVCFEPFTEVDRMRMKRCHAQVCKSCLGTHIATKEEELKYPIQCTEGLCKHILRKREILKAEPSNFKYKKWRKQTFLNLEIVFHCPGEHCKAILYNNKKEETMLCKECYQSICTKCYAIAHPGFPCDAVDRITLYLQGEDGWGDLIKKGIVQRCPNCQFATIRTAACLHIKCPKCKTQWNYEGEYRSEQDETIDFVK